MTRFLDTNVLLDIATADPIWLAWSEGQFRVAVALGAILINPIIYAELAPAFATQADLDRWLDPAVFQRLPLPYSAGWLAAQAFIKYRRGRNQEFTFARLLHWRPLRSWRSDACDTRRCSLSHLLSKRHDHFSLAIATETGFLFVANSNGLISMAGFRGRYSGGCTVIRASNSSSGSVVKV